MFRLNVHSCVVPTLTAAATRCDPGLACAGDPAACSVAYQRKVALTRWLPCLWMAAYLCCGADGQEKPLSSCASHGQSRCCGQERFSAVLAPAPHGIRRNAHAIYWRGEHRADCHLFPHLLWTVMHLCGRKELTAVMCIAVAMQDK